MWAGGKSTLITQYKERGFLPESFDNYIEPFLGGGAMFIWAHEQNPEAEFCLNDINPYIISIYRAIKTNPSQFNATVDKLEGQYLSLAPPTQKVVTQTNGKKKTQWLPHPLGAPDKSLEKTFRTTGNNRDWVSLFAAQPTRRTFFFKTRQEYQQLHFGRHSVHDSAILYFLMKTAFNGLWQTKVGTDLFNTPCGLMRHTDSVYNKENVMEWHEALQNCHLLSADFRKTIPYVGKASYIFLDPPYRGCFTQYGVDFDDALQQSVVDYLNDCRDLGAHVMMSNRDVGDDFFEDRAGTNSVHYFDVTYTAGRRKLNKKDQTYSAKKATEILMIGHK